MHRREIVPWLHYFRDQTYTLFNALVYRGLFNEAGTQPRKMSHGLLIRVIQEYGIKLYNKGVCHWLAAMSINSFYCRDMDTLTKRLYFLCEDTHAVEKIKQAKERIAEKKSKITEEDYSLIDAAAFLESEITLMQPERHSELLTAEPFVVFRQSDSEKFVSLVAGNELTKRGGLAKAGIFSGCYYHDKDKSELVSLFSSLQESILNSFSNGTLRNLPGLAFQLSSINHAITVIFDIQKKCWLFIDINQLPPKEITDKVKLANLVYNAFEFNTGNYTVITSRLLVPADSLAGAKEFLKSFQETDDYQRIHTVTVEKATTITKKYSSQWLYTAVTNGEYELVKKLIAAGADLTYANIDREEQIGYTLLYMAASNNHTEIEEFLTKKWLEHYLLCSKALMDVSADMRKKAAAQLNKKLMDIIDSTDKKLKDKYKVAERFYDGFHALDKFLILLSVCTLIDFSDLVKKSYYQAEMILRDNLPEYKIQEKFDSLLHWVGQEAKSAIQQLSGGLSHFGLFWDSNPKQKEIDDLNKMVKENIPYSFCPSPYTPYK